METPELAHIALHDEITFFQEMQDNVRKILDLLEKKQGNQVKPDINCFYAPSAGQKRPWKELYLISGEWQSVREYLMRKSPLYYFYEPPLQGLVNQDPSFWIFPTFDQLQKLCYRERLKLNNLSQKAVKQIPYQNAEPHFQKSISEILHDEEKVYSKRVQESEKYLKLVSYYLPKKNAKEVLHMARIMLKVGLHHEIEELIRITEQKVLVDRTKLNRRMRAIHTLSMKYYFFNASDEEKHKIDSLVGRDKGGQLKALKYLEKKVSRSFDISKTKDQIESMLENTTPSSSSPAAKKNKEEG